MERTPKNLFDFAPNELTGSAFWAWILQSLYVKNAHTAHHHLAEAFCKEAGILANRVKDVRTEWQCGKNGRVDIALFQEALPADITNHSDHKPFVIIENKVFSTPKAEDLKNQLERYAGTNGLNDSSLKKVAMSWRYETQTAWGCKDMPLLNLEIQRNILQDAAGKGCPIIDTYAEYALKTWKSRKARLKCIEEAETFAGLAETDVLQHPDAQWAVMHHLMPKETGKFNLKTIGTSSGRPWLQWSFNKHHIYEPRKTCEEKEKIQYYRTFFYRLDHDKQGYYLRLNYYTKDLNAKQKNTSEKQAMLAKLQEVETPHASCLKITPEQSAKHYESTLWKISFAENNLSINGFAKELNAWHNDFVKHTKALIPALSPT